MDETENKIREAVDKDVHNREFVIRFNQALNELSEDPYALSTFSNAIMPVLRHFAKQNNKSLKECVEGLLKAEEQMAIRFGEQKLMFLKKEGKKK